MILLKKTGFVKILLFIFLLWKIIFAADIPDGKVFIKSLNITGLKHTNKGIVLRELTFSIPSEISMEEIEDFKTRLNNLIIIKRVQTTITDSILTINIEEAPRYNIFPGLEIIERSWEKINYSLNFTHFNLFKDKIYMNLNTSIGYNPGFSFYIMDDWFTSKRYILGFKAYSGRIKHKLHPFTEKHKLLSIVVGKRINRDLYFTMNNGIHFISFPKEELEFFEKENYFTKLYQFGAGLSFDKRNYKFFPTDGFYLST
ncbi:MAG: BamA/TamA family outer membrane protein, partial [Calditrichia bacterium]|nr:BamA/TamA family outer membrane protein [Calditrichia bacterium]